MPWAVLVRYCMFSKVERKSRQAFSVIPSRCASMDGKSITMRSKHDLASLSNVDPLARERRTME